MGRAPRTWRPEMCIRDRYGKEYWVQDEKIIDGITYTAMIRKEREGDTFEETFTLYKWFAK